MAYWYCMWAGQDSKLFTLSCRRLILFHPPTHFPESQCTSISLIYHYFHVKYSFFFLFHQFRHLHPGHVHRSEPSSFHLYSVGKKENLLQHCPGLYMHTVCRIGGFLRSCTGYWSPASEHEVDLIFASRAPTKATWAYTSRGGKTRFTPRTGARRIVAGEKRARKKENNKATSDECVFLCIHSSGDLNSHNRCFITIKRRDITLWAQIEGLSKPMDATHAQEGNSVRTAPKKSLFFQSPKWMVYPNNTNLTSSNLVLAYTYPTYYISTYFLV